MYKIISLVTLIILSASLSDSKALAQEECSQLPKGSYKLIECYAKAGDKRAQSILKKMKGMNKNVIREETSPKVTNFKMKGSLQSHHDIGCAKIKKLTTKITPADMFKGVTQCINSGKYKKAAQLHFLARHYGAFDGQRVSDRTARGAVTVLQMNTYKMVPKDKISLLQEQLKKLSSPEAKEKKSFCAAIHKLGHPSYHPDYMVLHGLAAFSEAKTAALKSDFNAEQSWAAILEKSCPLT